MRRRRLTLLVNVWRAGEPPPADVMPLPDDVVAALPAGPPGALLRRACGRAAPPPPPRVIDVTCLPHDAPLVTLDDHADGITAPLPADVLRKAATEGGDPSFVVVFPD